MHAIFILTNKSKSYSYVVKLFKIITINKILLILFDILPTILRKKNYIINVTPSIYSRH